MQHHLDDSCNHWFVKPCQCPVDSRTCGSGRQHEADLEAPHSHSLRHLWILASAAIKQHQHNVADDRFSQRLLPESIWCSPAVQTSSSAGNVTGPAISALRTSCALAILHCWQDIAIELGAGTSPPVHIATAPTRRQSTWCYSVQPTTRSGQISGLEENLARILDAFGTSWSGLGRLPASPHLTGSERTSVLACLAGVKLATPNNV